mgnify:CR=1 FL=1
MAVFTYCHADEMRKHLVLSLETGNANVSVQYVFWMDFAPAETSEDFCLFCFLVILSGVDEVPLVLPLGEDHLMAVDCFWGSFARAQGGV